jgi:hypothetical protein
VSFGSGGSDTLECAQYSKMNRTFSLSVRVAIIHLVLKDDKQCRVEVKKEDGRALVLDRV